MSIRDHLRIVDEIWQEATRERRMLELALGRAHNLLYDIDAAPISHTATGRYYEVQVPVDVLDEIRALVARMKEGL